MWINLPSASKSNSMYSSAVVNTVTVCNSLPSPLMTAWHGNSFQAHSARLHSLFYVPMMPQNEGSVPWRFAGSIVIRFDDSNPHSVVDQICFCVFDIEPHA